MAGNSLCYVVQKPTLLVKRNALSLALEKHSGKKLLHPRGTSRVLRVNTDSVGKGKLHLLVPNQQGRQLG